MEHAQKSESAIELMMRATFDILSLCYRAGAGRQWFSILTEGETPDFSKAVIAVTPQFQWKGYRIDFRLDYEGLNYPVFVECDGHDFHERTKEQAERDRTKDRLIQESGIAILRFTGREIYRDPMDCVLQIARFLRNRAAGKAG
jgi:very-short-patch-repair endonuclease